MIDATGSLCCLAGSPRAWTNRFGQTSNNRRPFSGNKSVVILIVDLQAGRQTKWASQLTAGDAVGAADKQQQKTIFPTISLPLSEPACK